MEAMHASAISDKGLSQMATDGKWQWKPTSPMGRQVVTDARDQGPEKDQGPYRYFSSTHFDPI
jgi:hypothetical protein